MVLILVITTAVNSFLLYFVRINIQKIEGITVGHLSFRSVRELH